LQLHDTELGARIDVIVPHRSACMLAALRLAPLTTQVDQDPSRSGLQSARPWRLWRSRTPPLHMR